MPIVYYQKETLSSLGLFTALRFYNTWFSACSRGLVSAKLLVHIELDQSPLDLGNEISVIFVYHKPHRAVLPTQILIEVSEPTTMIFVGSIKYNPRPAV